MRKPATTAPKTCEKHPRLSLCIPKMRICPIVAEDLNDATIAPPVQMREEENMQFKQEMAYKNTDAHYPMQAVCVCLTLKILFLSMCMHVSMDAWMHTCMYVCVNM